MADYIQVGVTALRDPRTGEPLEAVPLYVRAADRPALRRAEVNPAPLLDELAAKFGEYMRGVSAAKRHE